MRMCYSKDVKQNFYEQRQAKIGKNQAKAKQHAEAKFLLLENYVHSSSTLSSKNKRYSKKRAKNKCVYLNEVI